jgi:hypothetical protein
LLGWREFRDLARFLPSLDHVSVQESSREALRLLIVIADHIDAALDVSVVAEGVDVLAGH